MSPHRHRWSITEPILCLDCREEKASRAPSLEDLFTALTQTGYSAEIGFNTEDRATDPGGWWCYLHERLSGREIFEGFDSLRGALTAALTWTRNSKG